MLVKPDGSEVRTLTSGPANAGFPSWSPDSEHIVHRLWSDTAGGLRIVSVADKTVRPLTTGHDNFPSWSPAGGRIVFNRFANDDFDIYTIRPDGTRLTRLTTAPGNGFAPDLVDRRGSHPVQQLALRIQRRSATSGYPATLR
jgi:Tol biopolymer transport system component